MRREERSDTDLVLAARGDDPEAFGLLFDRWFSSAWNVARTIVRQDDLAADVAQDALLAAWQGLDGLRDPDAFGGWVLRITRNRALNRLAKEKRSTASGDDVVSGLRDRGHNDPVGAERLPEPDAASEIRDRQQLVWAAAAALGERDVSLLDLHLRHGLTPAEIAEETGVDANAAHQQLFRLRNKLGDAIGSYLLWRNGRPLCEGLAEAVSGQKAFDRSVARAVNRHQASCEHCSEERAAMVDPSKLFAAVPLVLVPSQLKVQAAAALQSAGVPLGGAGGGPASGGRSFDDGGSSGHSSGSGDGASTNGGPSNGSPSNGGSTNGGPSNGPGGPSSGSGSSPGTGSGGAGSATGAGPQGAPLLGETVAHAMAGPGYGPGAAMAPGSNSLFTRLEGLPRPKLVTIVGSLVLLALSGLALRSLLDDGNLASIDSFDGQALLTTGEQESASDGDRETGGPSADLEPSGPTASADGGAPAVTEDPPVATPDRDDPSPDPTKPTADPTDPTAGPTDPTTPPTEPTNPSNLVNPPTDPTTPPTRPTNPSNLVNPPTDPTDPPTRPTDPTTPPTRPTNPSNLVNPPTDPTDPPALPPNIIRFTSRAVAGKSCAVKTQSPFEAIWTAENTTSVVLTVPGGSSYQGKAEGTQPFCAASGVRISLQADGPGGSDKATTTLR